MTLRDRITPALRWPFMPLLLAFAAGVIGSYAMAPTSLWPLIFISLSFFYVLYAQGLSAWGAALLGFFHALGYFMSGLWWIGNALLVDGNEFAWVWPISVIGLPTLLALFSGVAAGCAFIIAPPRTARGFIVLVLCLSLAEWVRGHIFSGFPWNMAGYAWGDILPMAQAASLFGIYGLSALTIFWATLGGYLYIARSPALNKTALLIVAGATLVGCFAYGALRLKNNPTTYDDSMQFQIVQPNIKQDMKWDPAEIVENFEQHLKLSTRQPASGDAPVTVILWPETAVPPVMTDNETARDRIAAAIKTHPDKTYLVSGILERTEDPDGRRRYHNSLGVFTADGKMENVYSKTHLVPLGEFIPFQDWIPIKPVVEFSGFEPGNGPSNISFGDIPTFSPLICYEIIFSGDVVDSHANEQPRWIAAVTNDAWYGISAGPHQHFQHAVFRSIEQGLPTARSANTGISGLTDSYGRVLSSIGLYEEGVILSPLPQKSQNATLFSRVGNSLYFAGILVFLILCGVRRELFSRF